MFSNFKNLASTGRRNKSLHLNINENEPSWIIENMSAHVISTWYFKLITPAVTNAKNA